MTIAGTLQPGCNFSDAHCRRPGGPSPATRPHDSAMPNSAVLSDARLITLCEIVVVALLAVQLALLG